VVVSSSILPPCAGLFCSDVGGGRKEGRKRQCRTGSLGQEIGGFLQGLFNIGAFGSWMVLRIVASSVVNY